MGYLLGMRRVAGIFLIALLSACSSGGDGDAGHSTDISVSTDRIDLAVGAPDAETPPTQTVTATFGEDVAHLAVIHNGTAIANVTSQVQGRTAQITIEPAAPSELGSGVFPGNVAITGYFCANPQCSSLAAGKTGTVTVRYQISPVLQTIAPYVGFANVSDTAIIRGVGFRSFDTQGVRFGTIPAVEFAVASETDLRVTYPALAPGDYEVQIDIPDHQGTLQSTARLVIVEPTNYAAQALGYPAAQTAVHRVVYDAERSAAIVATQGGNVIRYAYANGAWQAPSSISVTDLQDVALSTQGDRLLVLTRGSLIISDPVTLAPIATATPSDLPTGAFLKNLAATNEDRAFVTTGQATSGSTPVYLFDGRNNTLLSSSQTLNNGTPAAAGQGSSLLFVQGHPSITTATPVYLFSTADARFSSLGVTINQNSIYPVVDKAGTRAVLNGVRVHGTTPTASFKLLGTLPDSTAAVAVNMQGTRAYTYDPTGGGILVFDVSADREGAAFTALGTAVALPADPGTNVRMTLSPDGRALFIAGSTQLVVQPTPAL